MWQNFDMIATSAPTAVRTGGSGVYHDNYGRDLNRTGKNGLFLLTQFLVQLRRSHPCLRQERFGDLALDQGGDVTYWFKREDGVADLGPDARCLQWRIDGSAIGDADFLACINMWSEGVTFVISPARPNHRWLRIIDTAPWAEADGNFWRPSQAAVIEAEYRVNPYSILVLLESASAA
jgi:glycogen operon protein